jgi:hypothetical protein
MPSLKFTSGLENVTAETAAETIVTLHAEIERLTRERDAMRAALEKIADPLLLPLPGYTGMERCIKTITAMRDIAKSALALNEQQALDTKP